MAISLISQPRILEAAFSSDALNYELESTVISEGDFEIWAGYPTGHPNNSDWPIGKVATLKLVSDSPSSPFTFKFSVKKIVQSLFKITGPPNEANAWQLLVPYQVRQADESYEGALRYVTAGRELPYPFCDTSNLRSDLNYCGIVFHNRNDWNIEQFKITSYLDVELVSTEVGNNRIVAKTEIE